MKRKRQVIEREIKDWISIDKIKGIKEPRIELVQRGYKQKSIICEDEELQRNLSELLISIYPYPIELEFSGIDYLNKEIVAGLSAIKELYDTCLAYRTKERMSLLKKFERVEKRVQAIKELL